MARRSNHGTGTGNNPGTFRRRLAPALLIVGYCGVVVGTVIQIHAIWGSGEFHKEQTAYLVAIALGVGLAGFACWRWTVASRTAVPESKMGRGPTRWMALASLVFAAAPAAQAYLSIEDIRQFEHFLHGHPPFLSQERLTTVGSFVLMAGLLVAAVGFWILGIATPSTDGTDAPTDGVDVLQDNVDLPQDQVAATG